MTTLHPEFARIRAAHTLIYDAQMLSWARVRYFGPSPGAALDPPDEPQGLKAAINDTGAPFFIAFRLQEWARTRRAPWLRAHESWGDSEWMRLLLARYFLGGCESKPTDDDVKDVLAQGQEYAQAIVDAFS